MPTSRLGPPRLATSRNGGDVLLATILALSPLFPSGPRYLGLGDANYSLIPFVAILILWMVIRVREPLGENPPVDGRAVLWAWVTFLVVGTGAAAVALRVENDVLSPVFANYLRDLPADLSRPMNMLAHPFYPVAVWVVLVQGAVTFAAVRDLCLRAPNPVRRARAALLGWLCGWAVVSGLAAAQYVTRFQLHPYWLSINPDLVRSHATLEDPNMLGAYLVLGLGLALGRFYLSGPPNARQQAWPLALVLLGVLATATTVSRSAWFGLIVTVTLCVGFGPSEWLAVPLGLGRRLRRVAQVAVVGAAMVGATTLAARFAVGGDPLPYEPTTPVQAVVGTLDPRVPLSDVFSGRFVWWEAAFEMFSDQPLIGVGLGRYPRLVTEYAGPDAPSENAHSFPLQILAETGGLGFLAMGFLFVTVIAALLRASWVNRSGSAGIARGGLIGVSAFLVASLSSHPLLLASGQLSFATLLAPVLVAVGFGDPRDETTPAIDPSGEAALWTKVARGVALLALLWYSAAAVRETPPPWRDAPWGYSWGLFAEERARGIPFRWTGANALIELEVPPGATGVTLQMVVATPIRNGRETQAHFRIGEVEESRTFVSPGRVHVSLPLPSGGHEPSVLVSIDVDPVFVPAADGESSDARELGLRLFQPTFETN